MRALTIFGVLLVGFVMAAACEQGSSPGEGGRPLPDLGLEPVELALEPYVGRLRQLVVRIGDGSYPFLFDTGGGLTLIDPDLAQRAGCEPNGRLVGFRMSSERVVFQQCGVAPVCLGPLDFFLYLASFDLMALLPDGLPPLSRERARAPS